MPFLDLVKKDAAGAAQAHFSTNFNVSECKADVIKMDDGEQEVGLFEGYASTFENEDRQEDVIERGAFMNLSERNARGALKVKMFAGHNPDRMPGVWKRLSQDDSGLWAQGALLLNTQLGRETYEQMKSGALDSMSVGFRIPAGGWRIEEKEDERLVRYISKAELFEISLVPIPANPMATIDACKHNFNSDLVTERELERLLQNQLGMSRRQAKSLMDLGFEGLKMRTPDEQDAEGVGKVARDEQEAEARARKMASAALAKAMREMRTSHSLEPVIKGILNHE